MNERFKDMMDECPIIAAVKDYKGLEKCLESESKIIFVLFGDICNIKDIVKTIKASCTTSSAPRPGRRASTC